MPHLRGSRIARKQARYPQYTVTPTPPQVEAEGEGLDSSARALERDLTRYQLSDRRYMTEADYQRETREEYDRYFDLDDQPFRLKRTGPQ
ncbi:hypothetical protein GCM10010970_07920 [Silvimonas iriomotensis]|uniref:Uncharacterized protein n=2 Tax=Silvimonas iriomotensis TaxID=449662 RepID=A0ABQ2P5W7_9NEIS|nr:hypothetical protein GCM10010970_07920 [Silvimonas iriomotensis]